MCKDDTSFMSEFRDLEKQGYRFYSSDEKFDIENQEWDKGNVESVINKAHLAEVQEKIDDFIEKKIQEKNDRNKSSSLKTIMEARDFREEIESIRNELKFKDGYDFNRAINTAKEAEKEIEKAIRVNSKDTITCIEFASKLSCLIHDMMDHLILHKGWYDLIEICIATNKIPNKPEIKPKNADLVRIESVGENYITLKIRTEPMECEDDVFDNILKVFSGNILSLDPVNYGLYQDSLGLRFALYRLGYIGKKKLSYREIAEIFYGKEMRKRANELDKDYKIRRRTISDRVKIMCKKWTRMLAEYEKNQNKNEITFEEVEF